MLTGLTNALRGIGGEFELNRVMGFILGLNYGFGALAFQAWSMAQGHPFDIVSFCAAFSGGSAVIVGGTAGAVAIKDRNVASAKVTEATGAIPAKPPAGPQAPVPTDVTQVPEEATL